MTQLSNRTLGFLLVIAVIVSIGGGFLSFKNLLDPTVTGLAVDSDILEEGGAQKEVVKIPTTALPLDEKGTAVISISNKKGYAQQVSLAANGVSAQFAETTFTLQPSQNKKVLVTLSAGQGSGTILVTLQRE
ncbi:hypothetical protein HYS47_01490 [Candidatus Woesearchaeota archaeon]|nr:hypothetical protein [Candidatus Woesearchaeota archaeon]